MNKDRHADLEDTVRRFRNILPYLKDWNPWQREIRRLERNILKLRKNRYRKLARTLEESLALLKAVLGEEKTEHAFTVNQLVTKLDKLDRGNKALRRRILRT
jgi:hypothetical protein